MLAVISSLFSQCSTFIPTSVPSIAQLLPPPLPLPRPWLGPSPPLWHSCYLPHSHCLWSIFFLFFAGVQKGQQLAVCSGRMSGSLRPGQQASSARSTLASGFHSTFSVLPEHWLQSFGNADVLSCSTHCCDFIFKGRKQLKETNLFTDAQCGLKRRETGVCAALFLSGVDQLCFNKNFPLYVPFIFPFLGLI